MSTKQPCYDMADDLFDRIFREVEAEPPVMPPPREPKYYGNRALRRAFKLGVELEGFQELLIREEPYYYAAMADAYDALYPEEAERRREKEYCFDDDCWDICPHCGDPNCYESECGDWYEDEAT